MAQNPNQNNEENGNDIQGNSVYDGSTPHVVLGSGFVFDLISGINAYPEPSFEMREIPDPVTNEITEVSVLF